MYRRFKKLPSAKAFNDMEVNKATDKDCFVEIVQTISQALKVALFGDRDFDYAFKDEFVKNFKPTPIEEKL